MTLKTTLAAPFYHSRVEKLGRSELIYYYSFDRRWMDRDQVDLLLRRGMDQGLIRTDGEFFSLLFDPAEVEIPIGYKPSSAIFEVADPVSQLIDRIALRSGQTQEEVASRMNEVIKDRFDGKLRPEAALVILAKEYETPYSDLVPQLRSELLKKE
ncbi:MAG: DUF2240 family protein [Methanospirillum sp.]|uniref:DUF2240 family protein n=1 Tax=Methanospirillum sp. TaxID=45200 RepID=UPI00236DC829|nr:DUF2240 family protein [Methanospirillum sp.]MDD1728993.1 DUF2240 family protein [Methanospirillum sp.]